MLGESVDQLIKCHTVCPHCSKVGYIKKVNKGALMQLTPIASNMTEVETSEARILFSYRTPVAAYVFGRGYVKTEKWYSVTTTRHINKWMDMDMPVTGTVAVTPEKVEQTYLDNLV